LIAGLDEIGRLYTYDTDEYVSLLVSNRILHASDDFWWLLIPQNDYPALELTYEMTPNLINLIFACSVGADPSAATIFTAVKEQVTDFATGEEGGYQKVYPLHRMASSTQN
jgi:hypothetical protein